MRVLVLNRHSLDVVPYHTWLGPDAEIVLICDAAAGPPMELPPGYREMVSLPDYVGDPMVEVHAERLHERHGFDAVLTVNERDVLRAARLRRRWGLPGQDLDSALAFRDKIRMKDLVSAAGVPVARYRRVDCVADLLDAPAELGYPLVVKPRRATGADGVTVLDGEDELLAYLGRSGAMRGDDPLHLMAEEFVEHELYLVDGLVVGGRLVWSWCSWMSSNLGHHQGEPLVSSLLEADDPQRVPLQEITARALAALPLPDHTIIHTEIFGNPSRGLVFNEVASRVGGARIDQMLATGFGAGLVETYLRGVVAGPASAALPPPVPGRLASFGMTRPRPGVLAALPITCPLPGVVGYEPLAMVGSRLAKPTNCVSAITAVVTAGESRTAAEHRLAEALRWLDQETVIVGESHDDSGEYPVARR